VPHQPDTELEKDDAKLHMSKSVEIEDKRKGKMDFFRKKANSVSGFTKEAGDEPKPRPTTPNNNSVHKTVEDKAKGNSGNKFVSFFKSKTPDRDSKVIGTAPETMVRAAWCRVDCCRCLDRPWRG
jgi:hypothetical protein